MTIIQQVILARKDEEILSLYRNLEQSNKIEKAHEIRAAYIRNHTVEAEEIQWTNLLQTFVFEEALHILNLGLGEAILRGKEPLEYKNKGLQLSRVTSFLVAEMINQNLLDSEDLDAKEILFKELLLLSPRWIAEQMSVYLFHILSGFETEEWMQVVLAHTNRFLVPIDSIKEAIEKGEPINSQLSAVDFSAEVFLEGEVAPFLLENVQNTYAFVFAYLLDIGKLNKSEEYRVKLKGILNEEDFFYDIISVFGKLQMKKEEKLAV